LKQGIVIKVKNGNYYIDDNRVSSRQLVYSLRKIMAQQDPQNIPFLIVEADKSSNFDNLSPIMIAGSTAGFDKFKFAVIQGSSQ
ncbi:MAG: biopolymer transporter ExbD, partial [Bdellovibrionales bacterium]|nr:biopolymer transporter ExbD [Bdellovibrionales bacterium]